jgi:lysophospholipid acyltransferase (LPLAT)-like uncharacterized protein
MPASSATSAGGSAKSGLIIPHRASRRQKIMGRLVYLLIQGLAATLRFHLPEGAGDRFGQPGKERLIFAIWHSRLALSLIIFNRQIRRRDPSRRMAAIVSASRDGGMLAHILQLFGVHPVRGSTSRRGPQALRELTTCAEKGFDLAVTPDGPRGPRYVIQGGVISMSQLTGLPILPVCCILKPRLELRSWDRFQIPLPFSRCEVRVGELMRVPRTASEEERETLRQALESTMRELSADE